MPTLIFLSSLVFALIAIGLPLVMTKRLTPTTPPFMPATSIFVSMLSACIVCWCQYYGDVIWIKNADWSALQDVSESMAYLLAGFIGMVVGVNGWLLKRLKSVL